MIFLCADMATSLSLRSLLDNDKLVGSNFGSWYRKLKIVLEHEWILYVIMDPAPEEPAVNACGIVRDTYQKWLSDRTTVRCIMLAAMSDEFSHRFEMAQPKDMLQVLEDVFGTFDDVERHKTSCAIFNAKIRNGASITDHVLYMIELME